MISPIGSGAHAMLTVLSNNRVHGGQLIRFSHDSVSTKTRMTAALFLPPGSDPCALIMYLSGITCTDENVTQKGGAFKPSSDCNLAFLCPDTSPRGAGIAGEDDSWDFGTGAGFYCDATVAPYRSSYNMYSYVTKELLEVVCANYKRVDTKRMSIMGHSMGGHGALTIALRYPGMFKSVSALAPLSNPSQSSLGQKLLEGYLGPKAGNEEQWRQHDAVALLSQARDESVARFDTILIDQGTDDEFFTDGTLMTDSLVAAAQKSGATINLRMQEGYNHSYYFVSTFMEDHIKFHAAYLE